MHVCYQVEAAFDNCNSNVPNSLTFTYKTNTSYTYTECEHILWKNALVKLLTTIDKCWADI